MSAREEIEVGLTQRRARIRNPQYPGLGGIDANKTAPSILEINGVGDIVHERAQQVALVGQFFNQARQFPGVFLLGNLRCSELLRILEEVGFRVLAPGDVNARALDHGGTAVGVIHKRGVLDDPKFAAVLTLEASFTVAELLLGLQLREEGLPVSRCVEGSGNLPPEQFLPRAITQHAGEGIVAFEHIALERGPADAGEVALEKALIALFQGGFAFQPSSNQLGLTAHACRGEHRPRSRRRALLT